LLITCLAPVQLDGFVVRIISLNGREWLDRALDARWSRPSDVAARVMARGGHRPIGMSLVDATARAMKAFRS